MSETVKLKFPVKVGDVEVTSLVVERPKGAVLREMASKDMSAGAKDFWLMGRICHAPGAEGGLPDDVIDMMDGADIVAVNAVMQRFLSGGR